MAVPRRLVSQNQSAGERALRWALSSSRTLAYSHPRQRRRRRLVVCQLCLLSEQI